MIQPSFDLARFEEHVKRFVACRPDYEEYAQVLEQVLGHAAKSITPHAVVQARAKTVPSFAEKILRKWPKYKDPVQDMTDLCGARIVVHTKADVERICAFIKDHFNVDEANSLDQGALLRPTEFGYRSVHFIVQLRSGPFPSELVSVDIPEKTRGKKAEIQVRTIAQHAWADIGHDRIYKSPFNVPDHWRRESAKIAASLEDADDGFTRLTRGLDAYQAMGGGPFMDADELRHEIMILDAVRTHCQDDPELAHRIARLAIAAADWDKVIERLEKHKGLRNSSILYCLGFALCQKHKADRRSDGHNQGRSLLKQAVQVNARDVEAVIALADASVGCDDDQARQSYKKAFSLDSSDPRALSAYVRMKIADDRNLSFVPLIRSSLEAAIAKCREQVQVGINLPATLYTIGEFSLLLGRAYDSLTAYAQAIQRSNNEFMIDTALEAVEERLRVVREREDKWTEQLEWVRRLLLLAKGAKFHNGTLDGRLKSFASKHLPIAQPVILVAGGCDLTVQPRMEAYGRMLIDAFRDFQGTVISGGTTAGISGLVGALRDHYSDKIRAIGYVPRLMPAEDVLDARYSEIRQTEGTDFSPLEPLQNWIDLLESGIAPSRVKLLGINGGDIAAFEYRLAAILGARVALLRGSGRAADELIQAADPNSRCCLSLPDDPHTVRMFIQHGSMLPLPSDQRERLGQAIHEAFRANQRGRITNDPSMFDWAQLRSDLLESNCQQADHIRAKLAAIGTKAVPVQGREVRLIEFTREQVELLAEMEHARWNVERLLSGWTAGPRDPEKKQSPYLVGWAELPDDVKEWDRQPVRAIPAFLAEIDLEIQPL